MTQQQSILEKVQKLLELERSAKEIGSIAEAANAAQKVQALLLKHNLEMEDVTLHKPEEKSKMGKAVYRDVAAKKNEGQWIYRLYQVLADHNFCSVIYTQFRMENGKLNKYVNLIGTHENVIVVKFLAEQLEARLRSLEAKAWKTEGRYGFEKKNAFLRAYFMGACTGIDAQLRYAKRQAMENSTAVTALVVQSDKALQKAVAEFFPRLKVGKASRSLSAGMAGSLGYRDGKSMSINKGVGNGARPSSGHLN